MQHELSQTPTGPSVDSACGGVWWGGGESTECLLLWSSGWLTEALPLSFASEFGKKATAGQNVATSVARPPPTNTHSFDTKITLAGTCNSHISGFFASVIFIMVYFFYIYFCQFVCTCSGKEILAAELALHCSYAEHFGQRCLCMFILCIECKTRINTTDRYRLSICETAHALCLTVFCSTSR